VGGKVLEVRPLVPIDRGQPVRGLVGASRPVALFGGSDVTGLEVFGAGGGRTARQRSAGGRALRGGRRDMVVRAGLLAGGVAGLAGVLAGLLGVAR
jgi:hypothetical protein